MIKHLSDCLGMLTIDEGTVKPLLPLRSKSLSLMQLVRPLRNFSKTDVWKRPFIAPTTWYGKSTCQEMPPEESQVKLQHIKEHIYNKQITEKAVHDTVDKIAADKVNEAVKKMRMQAQNESHEQNEDVIIKSFVERSEVLMNSLYKKVSEIVTDLSQTFYSKTGFEKFIVRGSWSSAEITKGIYALTLSNL